ncbi:MAG: YceD family protein [Burkholderiaceae bacterium]
MTSACPEQTPIDRRLLEEQFPGGTQWEGALSVETERLHAAGMRILGPLRWQADLREGRISLQVQGRVGLTCTRCLTDLAADFSAERRFRLFDTAAEADAELSLEDNLEETLSTEDQATVLSLVEDELLLALEDLMVHPGCELPALPAGNDLQRPFAGLATLLHRKVKE